MIDINGNITLYRLNNSLAAGQHRFQFVTASGTLRGATILISFWRGVMGRRTK